MYCVPTPFTELSIVYAIVVELFFISLPCLMFVVCNIIPIEEKNQLKFLGTKLIICSNCFWICVEYAFIS